MVLRFGLDSLSYELVAYRQHFAAAVRALAGVLIRAKVAVAVAVSVAVVAADRVVAITWGNPYKSTGSGEGCDGVVNEQV